MSALIGKTLGPYEILKPLGAGGMGEVYLAQDTRLHRQVAVKVMRKNTAADAGARTRFQSEARAVAALSHPNILEIFDVGVEDGVAYSVSELLEGETLAELLGAGPLPPRAAIDYARQAALGLSAAHASGIVHRDIKPSNLFVTRDGRLKILDFGLAKSRPVKGSQEEASVQPTVAHTEPGTVMGTVGYMAPEQVRGDPAHAPADIFALGVVLYEMLSGAAPFVRETAAETMAAIVREDAPPLDPERAVPAFVESVLFRCLEKRPEDRFQSARDLAFALGATSAVSGPAAARPGSDADRQRGLPWLLLVAAALVFFAAGWQVGSRNAPVSPAAGNPPRLRPLTYSGSDYSPSVSPDGKMVAFVSTRRGVSEIWLRQFAGGGEQPLTSGPIDTQPRFAPDGSAVLFARRATMNEPTALYRKSLVGGQPRRVVDLADEGDWAPDGRSIAFLRPGQGQDTLVAFDLETETERDVVTIEGWDLNGPRYSPDGRTVALTRTPPSDGAGGFAILLADVASGAVQELAVPAEARNLSTVAWARGGTALVYGLTASTTGDRTGIPGRLVLQDLASGRVRNLLWTDGLFQQRGSSSLMAQVEVAGERLIVQLTTTTQALYEVDLDGNAVGRLGRVLTSGRAQDRQPAYSPDGERILFSSNRSGNLDLWEVERASGRLTQITEDAAQDWDPAYTLDGESILWSSDRGGHLEIWTARRDGTEARQVSHNGRDAENPGMLAGTDDLVYVSNTSASREGWGLYRVGLDGTDERLVHGRQFDVPEPSPDGRWVAVGMAGNRLRRISTGGVVFIDPDTGEAASAVVDIPPLARVTSAAYGRPRWFADGRLVYVGHRDGLVGLLAVRPDMSLDVLPDGAPVAGFRADLNVESFDISPDGRRAVLSYERPTAILAVVDQVDALRGPGE